MDGPAHMVQSCGVYGGVTDGGVPHERLWSHCQLIPSATVAVNHTTLSGCVGFEVMRRSIGSLTSALDFV